MREELPNVTLLEVYLSGAVVVVVLRDARKAELLGSDEDRAVDDLFDLMMYASRFHNASPVLGILTNLDQWIVTWLPPDSATLAAESQSNSTACQGSPGWRHYHLQHYKNVPPHQLRPLTDPDAEAPSHASSHAASTIHSTFPRRLCATPVVSAREEPMKLLQLLYSALSVVAAQKPIPIAPPTRRCYFILHKGSKAIQWVSTEEINAILGSWKTSTEAPKSDVSQLVVLEKLAEGHAGHTWLACTLSEHPALCVLKVSNWSLEEGSRQSRYKDTDGNRNLPHLDNECRWWHKVYPELRDYVAVETWSSTRMLRMPHFSDIPEH